MEKVTIYQSGAFGVQKTEATLQKVQVGPYAQYKNSLIAIYIPKGKRKPTAVRTTYKPYVLILRGHGLPDVDSIYGEVIQGDEITISKTKYSSFDDRYKTDFDAKIEGFLSKSQGSIIVDYRHTTNTEINNFN